MENAKYAQMKVEVTRSYETEGFTELCHIEEMPAGWVSDGLKEKFDTRCTIQPKVIVAPTGGGKSRAIYALALRKGAKTLVLEPRTAIKAQLSRDLCNLAFSRWADIKDSRVFEIEDEYKDIGLTMMTYQKFESCHHAMDLRQYEFVFLDEAHFFYSDAAFNPYADKLLKNLPQMFKRAHRVYLTATPGAVIEDICRAEKANLNVCAACSWNCNEAHGKMLIYRFPNNFDKIRLHYFRAREEIVDVICSNSEERTLIFTERRENSDSNNERSYVHLLREQGLEVGYLDRFQKGTASWETVCENGRFEEQVLVATSVLDCGVSIHDPTLQRIVVETTDKTEFLQMIGRRRLRANESLNVFVKVPDKSTLTRRLKIANENLNLIHEGFRAARCGKTDGLVHRGWVDESPERPYLHLFNYLGEGRAFPKSTAYHFWRRQKAVLEQILHDMEVSGDSAFPRLVHEWLEQHDGYDATRWVDFDRKTAAKEELLEYLESFEDGYLRASDWPEFSEKVKGIVNEISKFPKDEKRNLKRPETINKRLFAVGVAWKVEMSGTDYRLVPIEEN